MIRVSNRRRVRRLGRQAMGAAKTRNVIAVVAIALTTVLFTSLFTIALSINDGFQQSNFRQAGGYAHGSFKNVTLDQVDVLKEDPLVEAYGLRRMLGMPTGDPFQKTHVEVAYSDANYAQWSYATPTTGALPQEGTDQAAADTQVLDLLGVTPEIGAQFTLTLDVDGHETTQTFTLSGWWEHDAAIPAGFVQVPNSRVEAVLQAVGVTPPGSDGITGAWSMDVMLPNSLHIDGDMGEILAHCGFQSDDPSGANYVQYGVNWGYTGSQLTENMDPITVLLVVVVLVLILLTGYLIIYNVFQISVANDIRFYGLLKTIGTTGGQIKAMLRQQALLLSCVGIPVGLVLGWLVGGQLAPAVIAQLDGVSDVVSVSPVIFLGSAAFALLTVFLSCARPGRMAAKVSPVEAVRYTEGSGKGRKERKSRKGFSLAGMAWANLGRSKGKTVITVLSLTLAVVLLNLTVTVAQGFDLEKYVSRQICTDFTLADANHFQTGGEIFNPDVAVPQEAIDAVQAQGEVTGGGKVYGRTSTVLEYVPEDYFRAARAHFPGPEGWLDQLVSLTNRNEAGLLADTAQLYGMEAFTLDQLTVLEGDLSALYEPGSHAIAAVYTDDDYGNPRMDSHWARRGDTITLRYVEEMEYVDPDTGESYGTVPPEDGNYREVPKTYRDVTYTVVALVTVPSSLDYGYYGSDEFVLNSETFCQDTGTDCVMSYAFDTTDESNAAMEAFLQDYTENQNPQLDYESQSTFAAEFSGVLGMFLLLGGALSFIVGLVGVLNFFNAILTGILARRREFAVLQSIGMTGRQLKGMLIWEGVFYALSAVVFGAGLVLAMAPLMGSVETLLWFFTYHLTLVPVGILAPIFLLLGCLIPLGVYRSATRASLVERLRATED